MMPSSIENERSFLVAETPSLEGVVSKEIAQHYISVGEETLRLRRSGGTFEMTKKRLLSPDDKSRREELNLPLTRDEYSLFLPLAVAGLDKTRYLIPLDDGLTAELDVFHGPLEGLLKVEVEFPNDTARTAFRPPEWFGREVSSESWSLNANLAGKTWEDVQPFTLPPFPRTP